MSDDIQANETNVDDVETNEVQEVSAPKAPTETLESDVNVDLARELNITVRRDATTGKAITPSTPAMRAALARRESNRTLTPANTDIESMLLQKYGKAVLANSNIQLIVTTMTTYIKRMGPNSTVTDVRGGELQASLASLYDVVLSLDPELSQTALEIIVTIIKQNLRGAFREDFAFRFSNTTPLNKELSLRFQLLTTLFLKLAGGTKKKDLAKVINVRHLQEYITDRTAKANLSEFIN